MRAWSSARWSIPLPEGHRFPMGKYRLVRDGVLAAGLLADGAIDEPDRVPIDWLTLVHSSAYIGAVIDGALEPAAERRLGFPWRPEVPERSLRTVQGTVEAASDALERGAGLNLAGGTHHAFRDHGEGYCVFNDIAVAIRGLQRAGRIERVAVVDLDVHQGNGTARIFEGDPDVFTFSMHGLRNYPFRKERSRLDVALEDGTDDATYLGLVDAHLDDVLAEARPDLVFYIAGADPYRGDRLGRLGLSVEGLRARDRKVIDACAARGLPLAVVLGGGYADDLTDLVTIHGNTVRELVARHG
ncbi:MAG: histone deacetylase [Gemmatimonadales bacterium]